VPPEGEIVRPLDYIVKEEPLQFGGWGMSFENRMFNRF